MVELITQILFVLSGGVLLLMVVRKIPALVELEETIPNWSLREESIPKSSSERRFGWVKFPSYKKLLHKVLSKIRVLSLRVERKTTTLLNTLREESKKKQEIETDDEYWEELKKTTRKKDNLERRKNQKES